ncbi:hypothetical protein C1N51_29160 (plasmid) [Vibrio campbellii]|nr:hypothetical protein C1N51_29160 [Vibrio campbellii]
MLTFTKNSFSCGNVFMKKIYLLGCIQAVLASGAYATPTESIVDETYEKPSTFSGFSSRPRGEFVKLTRSDNDELYFVSKTKHPSNVSGDFKGYVSFAQSHTIAPSGNSQNELPRMVSNRNTLLMFTVQVPYQTDNAIYAEVLDKNGNTLGELELNPPSAMPKSDRPSNLGEDRPDVNYAENTWTGVIPWNLVQPDITIRFEDVQGQTSVINNIDIGGENEIVIHNIRIGMLTESSPLNQLEDNPMLAADYFQKLPITSMIVGNYSPINLEQVVLPNGTVYTESSATEGGYHSGDMRELIGKSLISMGINNANFGINETAGSAQWQPHYYNQYVAHKSIGVYSNGIQTHGLSGGNGMATLIDTVGNEFSHELGHAYGLGHYPGGGLSSTHNENSGWGWDALNNRFIANFFWNQSGVTNVEGEVTHPFNELYRYNTDAMAGGVASSPISQYTHHTGYTAKRIQQNFENTGRLTKDGYEKWNESTKEMESNDIGRVPTVYGTEVVTLVGYYDPMMEKSSYIYPALHGSFGHTFVQDTPTAIQCWVDVELENGGVKRFPLVGQRLNDSEMNKFHFNVARSEEPKSASVYCPLDNPLENYNEWLLNKFDVTEFRSWSSSLSGNVGDVYEYIRHGAKEYFRLKTSSYWYFPESGMSNHQWEFLGHGSNLNEEFVSSLDGLLFDESKGVKLNKRVIVDPVEEPQPTVFIGEENGYDQVRTVAMQKASTFNEIDSILASKDFSSLGDFMSFIAPHYNQVEVKEWSDSKVGQIGDIYHYANTYTGKQEFFLLKSKQYGYFPTNNTSNQDWKYLGFADKYINETPSPFDIVQNKTLQEHLSSKFNNDKDVLDWEQRHQFYEYGLIYKYYNPYNKDTEYFRQVRPIMGHYFPTDKTSNAFWAFIGDEEQFLSRKDRIKNLEGFKADILDWYKQDRMAEWGDKAEVGTIFEYKFHDGDVYYFRLTNPSYSYFPWPEDGVGYDHGSWEYMGKFDL